jgi:hypothetical protein
MNLLILAAFILLIIGLFNPQASLFWYRKQRTRTLSAVLYGLLFVLLIYLQSTPNKPMPDASSSSILADSAVVKVDTNTTVAAQVNDDPEKVEEKRVAEKLKAKAARDWPDDYTTQEYWINQELEDYQYMRTISDGPIKRQANRHWPYDYTTQKYWYDEQIAARQRLNNN